MGDEQDVDRGTLLRPFGPHAVPADAYRNAQEVVSAQAGNYEDFMQFLGAADKCTKPCKTEYYAMCLGGQRSSTYKLPAPPGVRVNPPRAESAGEWLFSKNAYVENDMPCSLYAVGDRICTFQCLA
ncbi:hypothetical protein DIPPA_17787 [Diplonema papillatum]|nr:hypothetical protein DIPPA_17787 [Diplonema papillatum]